jgi:multiple sugar transport system ATP-binding protein
LASVRYEHVTKKYGDVFAVNDLSLEVRDKEFLVLVGPSGCGKSTVIRLLAGLEPVTSGDIFIDGRPMNDVPAKDRDIAMVFQSYALYPHMSVFDNMAFGLRMRGTPRSEIKQRVHEAAAALEIEDLLRRKPAQLSGGQRQRVALGRAIVREPVVFLFDEPLSNLDAKLRVQTRAELTKLHERLQTTFIYVTHDQIEAMTMATRIAVLKDGLLQQVGTPEELYFTPDNMFVAGFIGSPSMNVFPATLGPALEEMTLEAGALQVCIPLERSRRLQPRAHTRVITGIRPEDIHDPEFLPPRVNGHALRAHVDVTEMMGNEKFLHLIVGSQKLLARVDPRTRARAGQDFDLVIDIDRLHLFDADTELTLDRIDMPPEIQELVTVEAASPGDGS